MKANKLKPYWFTPTGEKSKKKPFKVQLKPLDALAAVDVMDNVIDMGNDTYKPNKAARETLIEEGIVGWQNMADDTGDMPFSLDNVKYIRPAYLLEIINELFSASITGGESRKNS